MNNKRFLTFGLYSLFIVFICVGLNLMSLFNANKWAGVTIALVIFAICGIVTFYFKRKFAIPALVINGIASGMAISSVYTHIGVHIPLIPTIIISLIFIGIFGLYCLLSYIPFLKHHPIISIILYFILSAAAVIAITVNLNNSAYMLSYFLLLPLLAYLILIICELENASELLKGSAIATFSALVLIIVIVFVILSEGDGIGDCFDFASGGASSEKYKKDPYKFTN